MKNILVVDNDNSAISQMLEGWLVYYCGKEAVVKSAGLEKGQPNMIAAKAMMDAVIDITKQKANAIDELSDHQFEFVISLTEAAEERTGELFEARHFFVEFQNPANEDIPDEQKLEKFKIVRDEIENWAFDFVNEHIKELIPPDLKKFM